MGTLGLGRRYYGGDGVCFTRNPATQARPEVQFGVSFESFPGEITPRPPGVYGGTRFAVLRRPP
jgi:hypothetical protein